MSFDPDEDILNDFLIEAGEILEKLSEQLVDLEQRPDDIDLLNAIFRGFHTVKGGAGFLQLDSLVEICHVSENVFDLLRNRKLTVNADLMDIVLKALDTINGMFNRVKARLELEAAPDSLKSALNRLVQIGNGEVVDTQPVLTEEIEQLQPASDALENSAVQDDGISDDQVSALLSALKSSGDDAAPAQVEAVSVADAADNTVEDDDLFGFDDEEKTSDEINEDEFKNILANTQDEQALPDEKTKTSAPVTTGGDLITDDEFEQLLDSLHGKKKSPVKAAEQNKVATPVVAKSDLITDSEFDSLLDDLYGKGKGPVKQKSTAQNKPKAVSAVKVEPVAAGSDKTAPKAAVAVSSPVASPKVAVVKSVTNLPTKKYMVNRGLA